MIAGRFDLIGYSGRRTVRTRAFGNAPCRANGGGAGSSFKKKNLDLIRRFQIELSPRLQAAIRDPKVLGKFFDEYDLTGDELYHEELDRPHLASFLNMAIENYLEKKYPLLDRYDEKEYAEICPGYIWLVEDVDRRIFLEFVTPKVADEIINNEANEEAQARWQRLMQRPGFKQMLKDGWAAFDAAQKMKKN